MCLYCDCVFYVCFFWVYLGYLFLDYWCCFVGECICRFVCCCDDCGSMWVLWLVFGVGVVFRGVDVLRWFGVRGYSFWCLGGVGCVDIVWVEVVCCCLVLMCVCWCNWDCCVLVYGFGLVGWFCVWLLCVLVVKGWVWLIGRWFVCLVVWFVFVVWIV